MSNGGFDPKRLDAKRPRPVIPQILDSQTEAMAKGFTEIKVLGVGGAGNNTINRMIDSGVQGIEFVAVNSDAQALDSSLARKRLHIGHRITSGLGTGGDARLGEKSAEAARDDLEEVLDGADMVFITAGLGGGTGTGASPTVAAVAQEVGALTVGIVTLPFAFEGRRRRAVALEGLERLRPLVDALIVVSNDRLLQIAPQTAAIDQSFRMADETLHQGIHGIADLIITPGLINLDFADVRSIMHRSGTALMAMGSASGEDRAAEAARSAISSPLLESSITGARGILLNITGGPDLTLHEVNTAAQMIQDAAAPDANIIFGAVIHPLLSNEMRITVIAAGFGKR
ncbi:MAG: cell division protein FtsZ [Chloroflexota bacterium]